MGREKTICEQDFANRPLLECTDFIKNYVEACKPSEANPHGGCANASSTYTCSEQECLQEGVKRYGGSSASASPSFKTVHMLSNERSEVAALNKLILAKDWTRLQYHLLELMTMASRLAKTYRERVSNYLDHASKDPHLPQKVVWAMRNVLRSLAGIKDSGTSQKFVIRAKLQQSLESFSYRSGDNLTYLPQAGSGSVHILNEDINHLWDGVEGYTFSNFALIIELGFIRMITDTWSWGFFIGFRLEDEYSASKDKDVNLMSYGGQFSFELAYRLNRTWEIAMNLGVYITSDNRTTLAESKYFKMVSHQDNCYLHPLLTLGARYYVTQNDAILIDLDFRIPLDSDPLYPGTNDEGKDYIDHIISSGSAGDLVGADRYYSIEHHGIPAKLIIGYQRTFF